MEAERAIAEEVVFTLEVAEGTVRFNIAHMLLPIWQFTSLTKVPCKRNMAGDSDILRARISARTQRTPFAYNRRPVCNAKSEGSAVFTLCEMRLCTCVAGMAMTSGFIRSQVSTLPVVATSDAFARRHFVFARLTSKTNGAPEKIGHEEY